VTGQLALPLGPVSTPRSTLSPAVGPTCAHDHGDEGLGQRGPDSLPSPQPSQDPRHGAELCAGHPVQPFAHQQVKPEGWGPVPCPDVSLVSVTGFADPMSAQERLPIAQPLREHFALAHFLPPPGK